jgi:hypothetical protein
MFTFYSIKISLTVCRIIAVLLYAVIENRVKYVTLLWKIESFFEYTGIRKRIKC